MNIDLMPHDTPPWMQQAWADCMVWAVGNTTILAAFGRDTGIEWAPGKTPFGRAIDEATGADKAFFRAFIEWANVNVWGKMEGGDEDFQDDRRSTGRRI